MQAAIVVIAVVVIGFARFLFLERRHRSTWRRVSGARPSPAVAAAPYRYAAATVPVWATAAPRAVRRTAALCIVLGHFAMLDVAFGLLAIEQEEPVIPLFAPAAIVLHWALYAAGRSLLRRRPESSLRMVRAAAGVTTVILAPAAFILTLWVVDRLSRASPVPASLLVALPCFAVHAAALVLLRRAGKTAGLGRVTHA